MSQVVGLPNNSYKHISLSPICRGFLPCFVNYKLEAQVSLYRSPDINKPSKECLHAEYISFTIQIPQGSTMYAKAVSALGSHLEWRSRSPDTILKIDHLRTIHAMFALNWWFQRRRFLNIFPIGFYVKTMSADGGHLGWRSDHWI